MKYLIAAIALMTCSAAHADDLQPWQDRAVELVKEEKQVFDATWSQSISLWVSMADNGSKRDGFGEYLCFVLQDAGRPAGEFVAISIWDVATVNSNSPNKIGKATCTF